MSRPTPRRARHQRHTSSSHRGVAASDYESDAQYADRKDEAPSSTHILHRTNTDLNLSVLKRYVPSIQSIVSIAANAVVYFCSPETQTWEKSNTEGTLFVCEQEALVVGSTSIPRACVFVLNRRGLDNAIVDMAKVSFCEVQEDLLILKMEDRPTGSTADDAGDATEKVMGLWMHADQDDTRKINTSMIQKLWHEVTQAAERMLSSGSLRKLAETQAGQEECVGPAMQASGRKLSISDLFGRSKN